MDIFANYVGIVIIAFFAILLVGLVSFMLVGGSFLFSSIFRQGRKINRDIAKTNGWTYKGGLRNQIEGRLADGGEWVLRRSSDSNEYIWQSTISNQDETAQIVAQQSGKIHITPFIQTEQYAVGSARLQEIYAFVGTSQTLLKQLLTPQVEKMLLDRDKAPAPFQHTLDIRLIHDKIVIRTRALDEAGALAKIVELGAALRKAHAKRRLSVSA